MSEKLVFMLQSGSDFTVVDLKRVPDVKTFIKFAFGQDKKEATRKHAA